MKIKASKIKILKKSRSLSKSRLGLDPREDLALSYLDNTTFDKQGNRQGIIDHIMKNAPKELDYDPETIEVFIDTLYQWFGTNVGYLEMKNLLQHLAQCERQY